MMTFSRRERALMAAGIRMLAGVDEAGRGPLAGPVVAGAVIFPEEIRIRGIADSKQLNEARRESLELEIKSQSLAWGVGLADHEEIDRINVLQAGITAMHRAVEALTPQPEFLLVDGNHFHHPSLQFETIIQGDALCFTIAAASILAKVHRDRLMQIFDALYPEYGFNRHKGYATVEHIDALRRFGPSPIHRRSFSVRQLSPQLSIFKEDEFASGKSASR